jgi:hypothetical protein
MAKKSNLVTIVLSVVLVLGLVYFFRPQMFNFILKQGFNTSGEPEPDSFDPEPDSFDPEPEGFEGCPSGEKLVDGQCVPVEGFFACVDGKDEETGESC